MKKLEHYWLYLFILLSAILGFSLVKSYFRVMEAKKEIAQEEARVEKLKKENERLREESKKVASEDYIEKQIRDKLGMSKEGETILVLPDPEILRKLAPQIPEEEDVLPDPNWKRWLKLFL